jgi:HK97 family phage major capsid protein
MDFTTMETSALIERRKAIGEECNSASGEALDAMEKELDGINAELESRKAAEEKRQAIRDTVAAGAGEVVAEFKEERKENVMTLEEIRKSPAYVDAYANYIKTGSDKECRALLTENASGVVPVPVIVDEIVRTAWERDGIMSRVRRTFIRGNLKVPFERSADPAYVHTEGTSAPTEESLLLGIVTMIPANIKKWISLSDEAVAMGGEAFLRYVYDELTYQIVKKEAALAVGDIAGAGASNTASAVGVPQVTAAPAITTIPNAAAYLSDEATDAVIIMNRLTEVEFISAFAAGSFAVDPFAGLTRVYTSALPAYSTASAGDVYAIVGDLNGEQFNYPEGDDVIIKWDELSEAEADLVKVVGRVYAAHGVTAPGRFVNVKKPSAQT